MARPLPGARPSRTDRPGNATAPTPEPPRPRGTRNSAGEARPARGGAVFLSGRTRADRRRCQPPTRARLGGSPMRGAASTGREGSPPRSSRLRTHQRSPARHAEHRVRPEPSGARGAPRHHIERTTVAGRRAGARHARTAPRVRSVQEARSGSPGEHRARVGGNVGEAQRTPRWSKAPRSPRTARGTTRGHVPAVTRGSAAEGGKGSGGCGVGGEAPARPQACGRGRVETRRTPGSGAGCNTPVRSQVAQAVEAVGNREGGTCRSLGKGRPRGASAPGRTRLRCVRWRGDL